MKRKLLIALFVVLPILIFPQNESREVAITIDDLPVASLIKDISYQQKLTNDLLAKLKKYDVPVIARLYT